jgi:4-hydroxybutyrate dehydrogenase
MKLVKDNLLAAFEDGSNIEARAHMMSAAAMGATAFQKGLGAIHALSHPIGAVHHTHHGTTNAVVMLPVLRFNKPKVRRLLARAANYLSISGGFDGFCAYVQELNGKLGIPANLTDLGVSDPDIDALVASALKDPSCGGNPVKMTPANTRKLLLDCF